jgi:epoxyqueuosine reductase
MIKNSQPFKGSSKMTKTEKTQFIKATFKDIGFTHIGISKPHILSQEKIHLNEWITNGHHGSMQWIAKRQDERGDVFQYFPEVKSIISVGLNYYTGRAERNDEKSAISNYAWGDDYHDVLKLKLYESLKLISQKIPIENYRVCVDTSPVMDKVWAQKSGIGWIGKHTNIITQDYGSWIFIGELMLDVELDFDSEFSEDLCGSCNACLDACPTDAIFEPYKLDSNKCISYQTIEHRGDFDENINLEDWIYGCDICQEVCPWNNKFEQESKEEAFQPRMKIINKTNNEWLELTQDQFSVLMKNSAMKRTKHSGIIRNIKKQFNAKIEPNSKNIIPDE